jgi:uncharacterized membrane protein
VLASAVTLFVAGLASDAAYYMTFEIQWKNFATWLILGALVFGGLSLLFGLIDIFRRRGGARRAMAVYFIVLLIAWGIGIANEFVHAKDAWATMPEGLILSAISAVLALIAAGLGFSHLRAGDL